MDWLTRFWEKKGEKGDQKLSVEKPQVVHIIRFCSYIARHYEEFRPVSSERYRNPQAWIHQKHPQWTQNQHWMTMLGVRTLSCLNECLQYNYTRRTRCQRVKTTVTKTVYRTELSPFAGGGPSRLVLENLPKLHELTVHPRSTSVQYAVQWEVFARHADWRCLALRDILAKLNKGQFILRTTKLVLVNRDLKCAKINCGFVHCLENNYGDMISPWPHRMMLYRTNNSVDYCTPFY